MIHWGTLRFGDVNADGQRDVCVRDADGVDCWLSEDDGAHWRIRRTRVLAMRAAWVRGRTVVLVDTGGKAWHSPDGGFALESLAGPVADVREQDGELVVTEKGRDRLRVDAGGSVHRF